MLIRVALIAAIGGFLFGYDVGLMGSALLDIRQSMKVGQTMQGVLVGASKMGAVAGTLLGGAAMLRYGRRRTLAIDAFVFMIGPLVTAFAPNVWVLLTGRLISGTAVGMSAVTVPVYLGELAPARIRGRVVESYEVMLTVGGLAAVLTNAGLHYLPHNWRFMVGMPLLPAVCLALGVLFIPESPRWLVVNGRLHEALAVIHRVLTSERLAEGVDSSNAEVESELLELWNSVEKESAAVRERRENAGPHPSTPVVELAREWDGMKPSDSVSPPGSETPSVGLLSPGADAGTSSLLPSSTVRSDVSETSLTLPRAPKKPSYIRTLGTMIADIYQVFRGPEHRAVRMALVLAVLNQAFASTSVISYAPTLLFKAGLSSTSAASLATGVVSGGKLIGVLLGLLLIDHAGRRPLLIVGSAACSVALVFVAVSDWLASAVLLLISMSAFVLAFSASWAGVFWVLLSEVFSMGAKSPAASAATATMFISGAATDVSFLPIHAALGAFSFVIYALVALIAAVYAALAVPETRGHTLAEVQAIIAGRRLQTAHELPILVSSAQASRRPGALSQPAAPLTPSQPLVQA